MDEKIVKALQRQLGGLCAGLEGAPDEAALPLMLQTGASLLRLCSRIPPEAAAKMSRQDLDGIEDSCAMLASGLNAMLESLARGGAALQEAHRCEAAARGLSSAAGDNARLKRELDEKMDELMARREENEALVQRVAARQQDLEAARGEYERLQRDLADVYPGRIESLQQEIEAIETELSARRDQYQREETRLQDLQRRRDGLQQDADRLRAQLNALPDDIRSLGWEMAGLERSLEKLSSEGAEACRSRIQELERSLSRKQQDYNAAADRLQELRNTLHSLDESHTMLDTRRQQLESDVLERMRACLKSLDNTVGEHSGALQQVGRTVDALSARIAECEEMRRHYAAWWDADSNQLDMVVAILEGDDPLSSDLRATLDPAKSRRLRQLSGDVQAKLEQMDELLSACIRAVSADRSAVARKVSQGPGRRE